MLIGCVPHHVSVIKRELNRRYRTAIRNSQSSALDAPVVEEAAAASWTSQHMLCALVASCNHAERHIQTLPTPLRYGSMRLWHSIELDVRANAWLYLTPHFMQVHHIPACCRTLPCAKMKAIPEDFDVCARAFVPVHLFPSQRGVLNRLAE